jgi:hypothetical protein
MQKGRNWYPLGLSIEMKASWYCKYIVYSVHFAGTICRRDYKGHVNVQELQITHRQENVSNVREGSDIL